ncbi:g10336 [Coccomyxa viridis]|uniref:G10336 protein n=1 Tax=Coccomyxa viridis TaxID=1274662 RepID=A0ABP1G532_9CHLO
MDTSVSALTEEHQEAMKTASMCDRRHRRLTLKAEQMKDAAVKALQAGNDGEARKLLEVKVKVLESAGASLRRAQINRALAAKLEEVLQAYW